MNVEGLCLHLTLVPPAWLDRAHLGEINPLNANIAAANYSLVAIDIFMQSAVRNGYSRANIFAICVQRVNNMSNLYGHIHTRSIGRILCDMIK